jgi:hypothetical protein
VGFNIDKRNEDGIKGDILDLAGFDFDRIVH